MNVSEVNLDLLKKSVTDAGFNLAAAWEDEYLMYAGSRETVPGTFGHPRFESTFSKRTRWLRLGNNKSTQCHE